MSDIEALRSALDDLLSGSASRGQRELLREAFEGGQIALATGERAVAVGGSVDGAAIVTGDENVVLSLDRAGADAVRQGLSSLFPSRRHQLPSDLADFEGRSTEVDELLAVFEE